MLKKILIFIMLFLPWFLASIIPVDYNYYDTIRLPGFAPPKFFYGIAWTIVYTLIAISASGIFDNYHFNEIPRSYKGTLIVNYLFNQSYTLVFFGLKNNFLGFCSCLGTFISCLFLCLETSGLKEKSTKLLVPYVLLSLFATILSLTIYVMNIY